MRAGFTFSFWFLVAIGVLMTGYFAKDLREDWVLVLASWMLVPYLLLSMSARAATSPSHRLLLLSAALIIVCYGFSVYFDSSFVHLSTLDFSPIVVPMEQSFVAVTAWFLVHHLRQRAHCDTQAT
jgi:hypothetical protein